MKKLLYISILSLAAITISSGCVTKQKYQELEAKYKECSDDKQFATNELTDCQNKKKDLEKEVSDFKTKVEKLKQDTLDLSHKLKQSEKDYARIRADYDNLARDISRLSTSTSSQITELSTNLDVKEKELNELQARLQAKEDSLAASMKRLEDLQRILDQKDQEVRALKDKVTSALKNFEGSGLKVEMRNGKVYVSMDEKLLFASGRWEVQGEGKAAIKELAAVLESDSTINVLIEGHTDNVPYNGSSQVKDNWDLSVMRATAVVKLLLNYGKEIDPQRISASGRGEFFPIDPANTAAARAKNRRTEIILTPKLDELFQIIDNN